MTAQTAENEMKSSSYKLVSREYRAEDTVVDINDVKIGGGRVLIIAGPCSVESESQIIETALLGAWRSPVARRGV
jgi:3-deoxy-D-arabino-heptulosonate 7-phosphate (DAHP) synthase